MKRFIIGIILLGSVMQGAFAQQIRIDGKVLAASNKEAMEYTNVVLQTLDSAFVNGTTTDLAGSFVLDKIGAGDYQLAVSRIGYQTYYLPIGNLNASVSLGEIMLEEDLVMLEGVIVTASNQSNRSDRKLVFPSERQVEVSTNGVNLLQQLMLPKLQINPMSNEVSVPGGGEVQFRINGVKVERPEIVALQPAEIIRVEYHDNPGLRYGNAEVVLDYIVRRPETGGNFGVDLNDAVNVAWGNNYVHGKVNHKKSEFAVNYGISHRDFYRMWRDNEEIFTFADGRQLKRQEEGQPDHGQLSWQNVTATYSYQPSENSMFNATFRYGGNNNPHMDYSGKLYNLANQADYVEMIDRTTFKSKRPALDLYYQQNLKNDQTIVFNVVGTYNYTDQSRIYRESREGEVLTDVNNLVVGKKYSIIGEGIYEKKLGANRISGGVRHQQSFSDNEYTNGHNYNTEMDQAETFAYAEFRGKASNLDYTLSAGLTRFWFKQRGDGDGYEDYTFNPRLVLHYTLPGKSFIRLRADINNYSPELSNLSNVEQIIDSLQIQRGNPNLKPYIGYRTELTYEVQKGIFYGNLWGTYEYIPKAIMDEKRLEGDKIIQTWDNQKNWQRLASRLTLRVGPIKNILQFSVAGGVNHYISNGNTYNHKYTNWFLDANVSAAYKKFLLMGGIQTNWNWFYGETMSGGENIHYILLKYNHKNLSLGAGMMMPFMDNYKQETENWSQYASYKKSNYIKESSRMMVLQLTYNFSFGRAFNVGQKRVSNSDEDSGVMSTGK
ncbi:carboxypeptidase-like regulatory domain-containing protein [Parabacteroides sp. OttesenSCG-928-G21]|nr:carboxypeptidase-like regulatory domain-containing protein [Parabacteroides sp. OttesenSCG-928-G21]